jgi:hypothetical protein
MEGAQLRLEREYDLDISHAWHSAKFNGLAQVGKLRGLKSYLGKAASGVRSTAASALAFFHKMKAAGLPVTITRSVRKPAE